MTEHWLVHLPLKREGKYIFNLLYVPVLVRENWQEPSFEPGSFDVTFDVRQHLNLRACVLVLGTWSHDQTRAARSSPNAWTRGCECVNETWACPVMGCWAERSRAACLITAGMFSSAPRHPDQELVAVKRDGWPLQGVNKLALRWELCSQLTHHCETFISRVLPGRQRTLSMSLSLQLRLIKTFHPNDHHKLSRLGSQAPRQHHASSCSSCTSLLVRLDLAVLISLLSRGLGKWKQRVQAGQFTLEQVLGTKFSSPSQTSASHKNPVPWRHLKWELSLITRL